MNVAISRHQAQAQFSISVTFDFRGREASLRGSVAEFNEYLNSTELVAVNNMLIHQFPDNRFGNQIPQEGHYHRYSTPRRMFYYQAQVRDKEHEETDQTIRAMRDTKP